MSDHVAFLRAIAADPADDTARLVYADWLDDRGHAARAAYLRAVVDVVRLCGGGWPNGPSVHQLLRLAESVPSDWRSQVGGRFALLLIETGRLRRGRSETAALGQALGCGYEAAADLLNRLPARLVDGVTFEEAHWLWLRIRAEVVGSVRLIPADPVPEAK